MGTGLYCSCMRLHIIDQTSYQGKDPTMRFKAHYISQALKRKPTTVSKRFRESIE